MGAARGKWCLLYCFPSVTSLLAFSASRIVPSRLSARQLKIAMSSEGAFDADSVQHWEELYHASGSDKSRRYVLMISIVI
jgi:hypothetical protein